VDFAYEVSRSLAACEGSLLVVDASQGVEAQTLANVYQAIDNDHEIVPSSTRSTCRRPNPERIKEQIEDVIGIDASDACMISAKTGLGVETVLEAIVAKLPAPEGDPDDTLKAMLVDSWYDTYLGVMVLVRVIDGSLKKGQKIKMMGTGAAYDVDRVGVMTPKFLQVDELGPARSASSPGSIKEVADTRVGDTITLRRNPAPRRCPASSRRSRWSSAASSRSMPTTSRICAPPWASCASTTPASPSRWKPRPRSASASAAVSSASCTWKSSRSGWSASSIST
jgi:GTP-binding protein LepA